MQQRLLLKINTMKILIYIVLILGFYVDFDTVSHMNYWLHLLCFLPTYFLLIELISLALRAEKAEGALRKIYDMVNQKS